jgi:L-threonylcarbamoyladenylate synthase
LKTEWLNPNPPHLLRAAELLSRGETVALPTETVYGLAANAFDSEAVLKIFFAKERPSFDPLIVHVSSKILTSDPIEALVDAEILDASVLTWSNREALAQAIQKFWPGPLTFILPKGKKVPDAVTSGEPTVGIRMPHHPVFQAVLSNLDFPLAAPSANRFGRISPTTAEHVKTELNGRISAIVDGGPCSVGLESTILQVTPEAITLLRPGKISKEEIRPYFGPIILEKKGIVEQTQVQLAPGMLDSHYAPVKPLFLFPDFVSNHLENRSTLIEFARTHGASGRPGFLMQNDLSFTGSAEESAQKLFSELRRLDEDPMVDYIIADLPAGISIGTRGSGLPAAIGDRLNRASLNKPLSNSAIRRDGLS